jgi:hypothetical protein
VELQPEDRIEFDLWGGFAAGGMGSSTAAALAEQILVAEGYSDLIDMVSASG